MRSNVGKDDLYSNGYTLSPDIATLLILKNNKFSGSLNRNELKIGNLN